MKPTATNLRQWQLECGVAPAAGAAEGQRHLFSGRLILMGGVQLPEESLLLLVPGKQRLGVRL